MKRRNILLAICVGMAFLVMLVMYQSTQAQRQDRPGGRTNRPPRGQLMMQPLLLEVSWAQVSFELGVADEALIRARKIYQEAWVESKKLGKKMEDARDDKEAISSVRSDFERLKSKLDRKLKEVLTPKQWGNLAKWEKETRDQIRMPPGPPPGP